MNKIYKVVWNAARGCFVVGSEFIRSSHTGGCGCEQKRSGCTLKRAVLTALLAGGILLPLSGAQVSAYSGLDKIHEAWQDAQIKDLQDNQQDVSGLKGNVSDLKDAVSGLKDDFDASKVKDHKQDADIDNLKGDVSGLKEDMAANDLRDTAQDGRLDGMADWNKQQDAAIEMGKQWDEKQNSQINGLEKENDAQWGAIGHNYEIDKEQGKDIANLKDDMDREQQINWSQQGEINNLNKENAMQQSQINGLEKENDAQWGAIGHNYEIDKEQGKDIANLKDDMDREQQMNWSQQGEINNLNKENAMQQGQINDLKDDMDREQQMNWNQQGEINDLKGDMAANNFHDAMQDGAIIVGIIKDKQQDEALKQEAGKREEADKTLQENIDKEAAAREDADKALSGKIDEETQNRTEADDKLQANINQEAGKREEADKTLQENIDKEAAAREDADEALSGKIDEESQNRTEADDKLQSQINDQKIWNEQQDAAIKEAHESVSVGNGLDLSITENGNENGGTDYKVSLKDDFTVGDVNGDHVTVTGTEGDIDATGTITAGNVTLNKDGSGTVSGLTNTTWDKNAHYEGSSLAATESQLHQAIQSNVGDRNYTSTHYVEQGQTATDAISSLDKNLAATAEQVNANTSAISGLNSRVDTLDGRIDKVGANAAALAALHPLDFDPDDKWDFAAGVGNYGGENAMAVGAFYRPNEDTMFSVGGSFGTGENMVNAGVSFKIGQGNHVSTSRVAMAKEIETLRHNVAQLTELVNRLVGSQDQIQNAMTTPFPDVPENHWAYETIEQMRERGIVEGYPDGTFGGDRQMTRYEFATIVYRAMQKGIGMNEDIQRLVEEFKPELELIRVDTIAQDSEGRPTIERVRVNKA